MYTVPNMASPDRKPIQESAMELSVIAKKIFPILSRQGVTSKQKMEWAEYCGSMCLTCARTIDPMHNIYQILNYEEYDWEQYVALCDTCVGKWKVTAHLKEVGF